MNTNEYPQPENTNSGETTSFQYDVWYVGIDEQITAYKNLAAPVMEEGLKTHNYVWSEAFKKSSGSKKPSENRYEKGDPLSLLPPKEIELIRRYGRSISRLEAIKTYSRQMVVLASSYSENMAADFVKCLFCRYPQRMYEFLETSENQKGKVDLKDILATSTKEQLLFSLATQAADNVMQGNIRSVMKRINRLTDGNLNVVDVNRIIEINEKRNKIVHELSDMFIDPNYVVEIYEFLKNLLNHLEDVAVKLTIPVDKMDLS